MKYRNAVWTLFLLTALWLPAEAAAGVWVTGVTGDASAGGRSLAPGEILPADAAETVQAENGGFSFREIREGIIGAEQRAVYTFGKRRDCPPEARDSSRETYKNLEVTGLLKASDPEGKPLTFTVTRQPRRGMLTIHEDGSFTYCPKQNKVGIDSFAYTASDPAGNVSREATVTITIIQPSSDERYTDIVGESCCFAAQWMKNTGIFAGETVDGNAVFSPNARVTQGQWLAMVVKTLEIPTVVEEDAVWQSDLPRWLRPYVAAAVRSGLIENSTRLFCPDESVGGFQAAAMVCSALGLEGVESLGLEEKPSGELTRGQAAQILYSAYKTAHGGKVRILN